MTQIPRADTTTTSRVKGKRDGADGEEEGMLRAFPATG